MSAEQEGANGVDPKGNVVDGEAGGPVGAGEAGASAENTVPAASGTSAESAPPTDLAPPVEQTSPANLAIPADLVEPGEQVSVGVGPWPGGREAWPKGDHYDPELLEHGDRRNVEDQYRYWTVEAISADIAARTLPFEVAIENLGHDFNIGSIVRTANALGARRVHIVGRRRWNRRGAMVTDRYMQVVHHEDVAAFIADCRGRGLDVVGIDNTEGSLPIESDDLRGQVCVVFGEESAGLSEQMRAECSRVLHITQRGSTRSMNVGHAAAIAMWAWVKANV